jgi:hypothetical protein
MTSDTAQTLRQWCLLTALASRRDGLTVRAMAVEAGIGWKTIRRDFLGYTFGRQFSYETRPSYLGASPSRKKIAKLCATIRELTPRSETRRDAEYVVGKLNQKLVGWANYFRVGAVSKAYGVVNYHVTNRLRRWLCAKHQARGPGYSRYPDAYLYQKLGLYRLSRQHNSPPNATA